MSVVRCLLLISSSMAPLNNGPRTLRPYAEPASASISHIYPRPSAVAVSICACNSAFICDCTLRRGNNDWGWRGPYTGRGTPRPYLHPTIYYPSAVICGCNLLSAFIRITIRVHLRLQLFIPQTLHRIGQRRLDRLITHRHQRDGERRRASY